MIIFIFGSDTYRSKEKYLELCNKYEKSNISYFELEDFNFKKFVNLTQTIPFLAEERVIILKDIVELKNTIIKDKIIKYLDSIPKSTIVIFYENKQPKKNNKLYKYLIKKSFIYEFSDLEFYELSKYVNEMAKHNNLNISNDALTYLIQKCKNDLWKISNEILKLTNFEKNIEKEDVELLVSDKKFDNIFLFIDELARRDYKKATELLQKLQNSGNNDIYIFSMIVYQFRTLLIVKDFIENSNVQNDYKLQSYIVSQAGISPFVVGNHIKYAKKYTFSELKKIYNYLLLEEIGIKNGKIQSSTALTLLLAKIAN